MVTSPAATIRLYAVKSDFDTVAVWGSNPHEALDVLSIHKRECRLLPANLSAMRESFEPVMKRRRSATEGQLVGTSVSGV